MKSIIIERPYRFVPPHRGDWIPTLIQKTRLTDYYLRRFEGITSYEVRGIHRLQKSLDEHHGILLAPNHCRYADPIAIGWVARAARVHVFAMASWHLFNLHWLQSLGIRLCGGFSIYREGSDRQSLETAIDALVQARRPLLVFPEGTVARANDEIQPLLDGVGFLARSAARRRQKRDSGNVVIHPVGIKYVFQGDLETTISPLLTQLEEHCNLPIAKPRMDSLARLLRINAAVLSSQEAEFALPEDVPLPTSEPAESKLAKGCAKFPARMDAIELLARRRERLMHHLLASQEATWLPDATEATPLERVRRLRTVLAPQLARGTQGDDGGTLDDRQRSAIIGSMYAVDVAQEMATTPPDYLRKPTATRQLETLARLEENAGRKASKVKPLRAILEVGEPIHVAFADSGCNSQVRATEDIMADLAQRLGGLVAALSDSER